MIFKKISLTTVSFITKLVSFIGIALIVIIFLSMVAEIIENIVFILREFKSFLIEIRAINSAVSKGIYSSNLEGSFSTLPLDIGKDFLSIIKYIGMTIYSLMMIILPSSVNSDIQAFVKENNCIFLNLAIIIIQLSKLIFFILFLGCILAPSIVRFGFIGAVVFFVLFVISMILSKRIYSNVYNKEESNYIRQDF